MLPPIHLPGDDPGCAGPLMAIVPDALVPGPHVVRIVGADGGVVCEAPVTVIDSKGPMLTPRTMSLWPPNHKLHTIDVADCVAVDDACEPGLQAHFTWISSDEPIEGMGAGKRDSDIVVSACDRVQLRAEREGGGDGRVYKLGVRVVDGAGNAAEDVCTVTVPHDKSGDGATDSGERYRIGLDGQGSLPDCTQAEP